MSVIPGKALSSAISIGCRSRVVKYWEYLLEEMLGSLFNQSDDAVTGHFQCEDRNQFIHHQRVLSAWEDCNS